MDFCLGLVLTEGTSKALPPNPELGPLPLYPHDDGRCSVLGPPLSHTNPGVNQNNHSTNNIPAVNNVNILAPIIASRDKVYCGSFRYSGNSGPYTCSHRSFTCDASGCARPTPFQTRQALNGHCEMMHLDERLNCPVPGCQNVGERGIKRHDNLVAHVRSKHGMTLASGSQAI